MTLAALEELKEVDEDTYRRISMLVPCEGELEDVDNDQYDQDIVQGCIQRACEKRGWEIDQNYRTRGRDGDLPKNMRYYAVVTSWDNDVHTYRGMGNSPAEALLAAYIAAVREEAKR